MISMDIQAKFLDLGSYHCYDSHDIIFEKFQVFAQGVNQSLDRSCSMNVESNLYNVRDYECYQLL